MRWQDACAVAQCGHEACPWFVTCHMAFPISALSAGTVPEESRRETQKDIERGRSLSKGTFRVSERTCFLHVQLAKCWVGKNDSKCPPDTTLLKCFWLKYLPPAKMCTC